MNQPYILKNRKTTLERAEKFISSHHFTDVNLFDRLYPDKCELTEILHSKVRGRLTFDQAIDECNFTPSVVGSTFGPTWSTHWFKLTINVPPSWVGHRVDLVWDSSSEALLYSAEGTPLQGLTSDHRTHYIIEDSVRINSLHYVYYLEMACNGLFGAGNNGLIQPPDPDKQFCLTAAHIVRVDTSALALFTDVEVLVDLIKSLPEENNRSYQALYTVNKLINTVDFSDRSTLNLAHDIATKFFSEKNGSSQHTVHAIGNCHIDSAWLWPYAESIRKCARSFSASLNLLNKYPDYTFVISQAQQLYWMKTHYSQIFSQIKEFTEQERLIPVGGTWVEMDGNLPSSESFIRQFLFGQIFFLEEFGFKCKEFWLPDTFGYSAQLPQIAASAGINRFVTQKLSWSLVNKFPHHTFLWEGLDGTQLLTHFPPGNDYSMKAYPNELMKTVNNFCDKGRSNHSMFLYGHGDGGQGPTSDMIERLIRLQDTDGVPKVKFSTPDLYFTEVEKNELQNLNKWTGELYLELHNGTYTTQALVKKRNRHCEFLLRDCEMICVMAWLKYHKHLKSCKKSENNPNSIYQYPKSELSRLWKLLLLNQFHDVLPGSSITMVYEDAHGYFDDIEKTCRSLMKSAEDYLFAETLYGMESILIFNTLNWRRNSIVSITTEEIQKTSKRLKTSNSQKDHNGNELAFISCHALGYSKMNSIFNSTNSVCIDYDYKDGFKFFNRWLTVKIDFCGRVTSLILNNREAVAPGAVANQFVIFDDIPLYWDAWDVMDYHLETRTPLNTVIEKPVFIETGPLRVSLKFSIKISESSSISQIISLDTTSTVLHFSTEVDWHESHKFLKVEFPVNVRSTAATYEIQSGHIQRPTHFNTSWDWAKFEVCGHKWADISEHGFGVAVLNDCKYGWSCIGNCLRLSLLRSPKAPDPNSDMGHHTFQYEIMPHSGSFQDAGVIRAAYELNNPLKASPIPFTGSDMNCVNNLIHIDSPSIMLQSIKLAEKLAQAVVIRLYESFGGQTVSAIAMNFNFTQAFVCNSLEEFDENNPLEISTNNRLEIHFTPFSIVSLIVFT